MKYFKYFRKRGLALFTALVMCLSLLPATAMAADFELVQDETFGETFLVTSEAAYTATVDDFMAACDAMGDADDEAAILAVLSNIEAVYASLSPEDQEAVADMWAYAKAYIDQVKAGNPDEGIETMALLTGEQFSIKVNYGYLEGGTFHLLESKTMVSTCRDGEGHAGYNHSMDAAEIVAASGYSGNWRVTSYGYWDSPASTTRVTYNITGSAPYKANQTIWVYGEKPTVEETTPTAPGTGGSSGENSGISVTVKPVYIVGDTYTVQSQSKTVKLRCTDTGSWHSSRHGQNCFLDKSGLNNDFFTVPQGYVRVGWNRNNTTSYRTDYSGTELWNSGQIFYIFYTVPTVPVNTFTLTYDANGGTVNGNGTYVNSVQTTDSSYSFNSIEPEYDGYTFQGWYTASSGGSKVTWPKTLTTTNPTATVYAHWEKVSDIHEDATVIYLPGTGGSGSSMETVPGSQDYTIKSPTAAGITGPADKVFSHWAKGSDMYFPGDTFVPADGSTTIFIAVWKDDDSQTGNTEYKVQWFDKDTDQPIKPEETRRGTLGSPVSVTASDKQVSGYIYASSDNRNLESAILAADTVLKLYFTKDPNAPTDNGNGISITKTRISADTAKAGDALAWNIVVTNNSNVEKTVSLTELPGVTLSKSSVTLAAGASETVTATHIVTGNETLTNGKYVNTVNATTGDEGDNENPSASDDGTKIQVTITVEFVDENGDVVGTETKDVDKDSEYDATEETEKIPEGYEAAGDPTGAPVKGTADDDKTITVPVKVKTITVTWLDEDGGVIKQLPFPEGSKEYEKEYPAEPTDTGDWGDPVTDPDTGNITIQWKEPTAQVTITVKFVDEDNNEVGEPKTTTVDKDSPYNVTEDTTAIPAGYERDEDKAITGEVSGTADSDKEIIVPVKQTVNTPEPPTQVTITVKFVDEDNNEVGEPKTTTVDKDSPYNVTEDTTAIPAGYERDEDRAITGEVSGTADSDKEIIVPVKVKTTGDDDDDDDKITVTWLNGYSENYEDSIIDSVEIDRGGSYSNPANPERDGYVFAGWGTPVEDEETGNITITAQWNPVSPVNPDPVNPDPVNPDPVNPDPVNPDPVDPDPVDPDPVDPDPVDPDPVDPDPVDPDPVDPDPVDPDPVIPAPVDPAPVVPAPVDPAPVVPAPAAPAEDVEINEPDAPLADMPEEDDVEIDEPDAPLADVPEEDDVEIGEPDAPLADMPEEDVVEIEEPGVPLADVPETGDNSQIWTIFALLSGAALIWLALEDKKRKDAVK